MASLDSQLALRIRSLRVESQGGAMPSGIYVGAGDPNASPNAYMENA